MKGDFSRGTFDVAGVSRVLMQQGRVQLDADWNAAVLAAERRTRTALADLLGAATPIGVAAVPREGDGFGIVQRGGLIFDGRSTYVRAAEAPSLNRRERFTLEAWIAPRSGGRGGTIVSRLDRDRHHRALGEFALRVDARGRLVFLRVEEERGGETFEIDEIIVDDDGNAFVLTEEIVERERRGHVVALVSTIPVAFGRFTHVAVVVDGRELALYVDGTFAGGRHIGRGQVDRETAFLVGAHARNGRVADVFDGIVDELVIRARRHRHHHHGRRHGRGEVLYRLDITSEHHGEHAPVLAPRTFAVTAGRAYVGGLACENGAETALTLGDGTAHGTYVAYLEAWERLITAADDPSLADPALGGLDTSAVVRTQTRVRAVPIAEARRLLQRGDDRGRLAFRQDRGSSVLGNQLVRVEVHRAGYADAAFAFTDPRVIDASVGDARTLIVEADPGWTSGQPLKLVASDGTATTTHVVSRGADGSYALADPFPSVSFGVVPLATVTWSRDNAALAFAIDATASETDRFTISDPVGRSIGLRAGDVVEIVEAQSSCEGRPGMLRAVAAVASDAPGSVTIELDAPVPPVGQGGVLRKWDPFLASGAAEQIVSSTAPIVLAEGLAVQCTAGSYRTGDYWWTAVRVDLDELWDWPRDEHGEPLALEPQGVERVYAPLAFVVLHGERRARIRDLRRVVSALGGERETRATVREHVVEPRDPREPGQQHHHHHHHHHYEHEHEREGLPHDALVLTRHPEPPRGYRFAGTSVLERHLDPLWVERDEAPFAGRALAVVWEGAIFVYVETTGQLWRYDPAARDPKVRWERRVGPEGPPRRAAALIAADARIYLIGGFDHRDRPTDRCDAYDPLADVWTVQPPLRTARAAFGAAVVDGKLVVVGGVRRLPLFGTRFASRRVESYTPGASHWHRHPSLLRRREGCAAITVGRRIYLVGGSAGRFFVRDDAVGARVETLAPFTGYVSERAPLLEASRDARVALVDGTLVVLGGRTALGVTSATERYPLAGEGGEPFASFEGLAPGLVAIDGTLHALAGETVLGPANAVTRCRISTTLFVHRRARDGEADLA